MTLALVVLALVAVLGFSVLGVTVSYNRFARQRRLVRDSWRQIDVELHRRYDLAPALIRTAQGHASREGAVFAGVTRHRAAATAGEGADLAQRATQEAALAAALRELFAMTDHYPRLGSDQEFVALQRQLSEIEDRIAAGRRFYNANVRAYNTRVRGFPSRLVASRFGFAVADGFDVDLAEVRAAPLAGPTRPESGFCAPVPLSLRPPSAPPADPSPQLGP